MNAGEKTIEWLYRDHLSVDDEWSLRLPEGFIWWADRNAQRIEVIGEEVSCYNGEDTFFVRVKTDVLRDMVLTDKALATINHFLMTVASMSGPIYHAKTGVLSLSSLVRTYESIMGWMSPFIGMAAVLQISEARTLGPVLAGLTGGTFAETGHPSHGLRPSPDELTKLEVLNRSVIHGAKPGAWSPEEFRGTYDQCLQRPPALLASSHDFGFTVEFPWGERSSLCQINADKPHPRHGDGLRLLQSFLVTTRSEAEGIKLALELNAEQLDHKPDAYGFGSYYYRDGLHFTGFLPSKFLPNSIRHGRGLLKNLCYTSASRARAMSTRFVGDDWSEQFKPGRPPKAKSATDRLFPASSLRTKHSAN